ncbi:MAG: prealbumin-like fold domain-containing protein [Cytophagaceae bacterium]
MSRFYLLLISCSFLLFLNCLQKQKKYIVKGRVTFTSSYCGGAAPTDEILELHQRQQPLANKTLYIRQGKENNTAKKIISTIITDSKGEFQISLPPGNYVVVDDRKRDKNLFNQILKDHSQETEYYYKTDIVCLQDWIKTPDATFCITGKEKSFLPVEINYHLPCSWGSVPCTQYTGPLPP